MRRGYRERRSTATATGLYDSFCHIFSFYSFSLHLFVSQKSLNEQERGGNCLLLPERSYGPAVLRSSMAKDKMYNLALLNRHDHIATVTSKAAKRLWFVKKLKRAGVSQEEMLKTLLALELEKNERAKRSCNVVISGLPPQPGIQIGRAHV